MNWLESLLWDSSSVAHIVCLYAFVISVGVLLGKIKIFGVSLGVTFVLFAGILMGHFGFTGETHILHFIREFGLILFVFCIGLQVGPSFFSSFKKGGMRLNMLAVGIVLLNIAVALSIYFIDGGIDLPMIVGSEVDTIGVISNPDTNEKIGIGGMAGMFAKYAIVDPELMKTVPPKFTAYQGFDALFHSLEGYISNKHNIMGDMIQRAAIENIGHYLARAVKDGNDIEAREHVAYANTMSGYSMVVTSCISEHSMEHAMSAYHPELPHGAGLIMLSKEYFTFWINKHVCDERFIDMAHFLGMENASKPEDFITALLELQKACGVDDLKMSDYGIKKEEAMTLAKNARATMMRLFVRDPQETTDEEIAGIYERAYR